MADPETKNSMRRSTRTSKKESYEELSPTEERASSENKSTFENTLRNWWVFPPVNAEMLTIAARTHADWTCVDGVSLFQQAEGRARSLRMPVPLVSIRTVVSVILDSRRRTSMETRCVREPDASYQCGKARFVNVVTDWWSNSSPCLPRQGTLLRYDKPLFFDSVGWLMKLPLVLRSWTRVMMRLPWKRLHKARLT